MIRVSGLHRGKASEDIQNPISKIEYYDSPFTVPTKGLFVSWTPLNKDNVPSATGEYITIGNDRMISHNFGDGTALGMPGVDYFRVQWDGYFYATTSGDYDFIINKDETSYAEMEINGNLRYAITGSESTKVTPVTLDSGWYPFRYRYDEYEKDSYTSLLFRPPDSKYYRPVSAGVTNTTNGFISPSLLEGFSEVKGSFGINQSRTYTITVPLTPAPDSSTYVSGNDISYYYDAGKSVYVMRNLITRDDGSKYFQDIELKQGRLIKIYAGYQSQCTFANGSCTNPDTNVTGFYHPICENFGNPICPANTAPAGDYIERFDGTIVDFIPTISKEGDKLDIVCQDSMVFLQEAFDKNYPDHLSYLNTALGVDPPSDVRFINKIFTNKYTRPKAYDSWPVGYALRDLLMKTHIDPSLLFGKTDVFVDLTPRSFYVKTNALSEELDYINLARNYSFGNSYIPGAIDNEDDDKYIWAFDFGNSIDDAVKRMVDTYGYRFGIKNNGYIYAEKVLKEEEGTINQDGIFDATAIGGFYNIANSEGTETTVTGNKIVVKTIVEASNSPTVNRYRMTKDASPDNKPSKWSLTYPHNVLMGAYWGPSGAGGQNWDYINYTTTRFGFYPDQNMTISGARMSIMADYTRGSYPMTGGRRQDYCNGMAARVYFSSGTYTANSGLTFAGSKTLIANNFRVEDFGPVDFQKKNYFTDLFFTSSIAVKSGGLYILEFVTTGGQNEVLPTGYGTGRYVLLNSFVSSGTQDAAPYNTFLVSGYSNESFSGMSDTGTYGSNFRVYNDIEIREAYPAVSLGNTGHKRLYVEVYDSGNNLITTKYQTTITDEKRSYLQGPDKYNDYYSSLEVNPWELTTGIALSGGSFDTLWEYNIKVGSTDPNDEIKIEQIVGVQDVSAPTWTFDTFQNIIGDITFQSNYQNTRNDVTVIGNQRSTEIDVFTHQVINKNNPTFIYTVSRSVDMQSIYDIDTPNSIGRRKEFMIFEPGIKSQLHADWLSSGALFKYRRNKNGAQFETTAVPFLDVRDKVYVSDAASRTPTNNVTTYNQFIDTVDETITNEGYKMNITTTPYEDWPSFSRQNLPVVETDDDAFVEVRVYNSNGAMAQTGSNVIITPSSYNVYSSEETGTARQLVQIDFTQQMEGFTTVKVVDASTEIPVAYLLGSVEDGVVNAEYVEAGSPLTLLWDGIDQFGKSKIRGMIEDSPYISGFVVAPESPNYYSFPGRYYVEFTVEDPMNANNIRKVRSSSLNMDKNTNLSGYLYPVNDRYNNYIDIDWAEMGDGKIIIKDAGADDDYTTHSLVGRSRIDDDPATKDVYWDTDYVRKQLGYTNGPRAWYTWFKEDENNGDGMKFKVVFDQTTEFPNRIYTIKCDVKHTMTSCIFIHKPILNINNLDYRQRITDVPYQGALRAMRFLNQGREDDAPSAFEAQVRDNYAYDNQLKAWRSLLVMDRTGIVHVQTPRGDGTIPNIAVDGTDIGGGFTDQYIDTEGLEDTLVGTPIMDKNIVSFRYNSSHPNPVLGDSSVQWGNRIMFSSTPTETIEDTILEEKKVKIGSERPWVEFSYNPKSSERGSIDFYRIPRFANQAELDTFKQRLREAFNIAKWSYGIDNYGYPSTVLQIDQSVDIFNYKQWAKLLGSVYEGVESVDSTYWRDESGVSNYVMLGVIHCIQFEIEVVDNTGRGMQGILQPARKTREAYYDSDTADRNNANRRDWELQVGGNNINGLSGQGPMLFGFDQMQDYNKFVFHVYWEPGSQASNETSLFGVTTYPGIINYLPANLYSSDHGKLWGNPTYAEFTKSAEDGEVSTTISEGGVYYYHEAWGVGAGNKFGSYKQYRTDRISNLAVNVDFANSKYKGDWWSLIKDNTSYGDNKAFYPPVLGYNIGPKWNFFRMPQGFTFNDIDSLKGIPIRGVVRDG